MNKIKVITLILLTITAISSCGCIEYGKGSSTDTLYGLEYSGVFGKHTRFI